MKLQMLKIEIEIGRNRELFGKIFMVLIKIEMNEIRVLDFLIYLEHFSPYLFNEKLYCYVLQQKGGYFSRKGKNLY